MRERVIAPLRLQLPSPGHLMMRAWFAVRRAMRDASTAIPVGAPRGLNTCRREQRATRNSLLRSFVTVIVTAGVSVAPFLILDSQLAAAAAPTNISVSPSSGPTTGGNSVTVNGQGFCQAGSTDPTVVFGSKDANCRELLDNPTDSRRSVRLGGRGISHRDESERGELRRRSVDGSHVHLCGSSHSEWGVAGVRDGWDDGRRNGNEFLLGDGRLLRVQRGDFIHGPFDDEP